MQTTALQRAAMRDVANESLEEPSIKGRALLMLLDDFDEARAEVTDGPSWEAVTLRSALVAMTVERDEARRQAAELDARLTRMTHESAARDRVAPMTAWGNDPGEVE